MDFEIDRSSTVNDMLLDLLMELGIKNTGRIDDDLSERMKDGSVKRVVKKCLTVTGRGVQVKDPYNQTVLLETRAYWWGNDDTPEEKSEMDAPNLEVPSLGLNVYWYKYAFRGSYSNKRIDVELVSKIRDVLKFSLDYMRPFVKHPVIHEMVWHDYVQPHDVEINGEHLNVVSYGECQDKTKNVDFDYDHAYISLEDVDLYDRPYEAMVMSTDEHFISSSSFETLEEAQSWCLRQCRTNEYLD